MTSSANAGIDANSKESPRYEKTSPKSPDEILSSKRNAHSTGNGLVNRRPSLITGSSSSANQYSPGSNSHKVDKLIYEKDASTAQEQLPRLLDGTNHEGLDRNTKAFPTTQQLGPAKQKHSTSSGEKENSRTNSLVEKISNTGNNAGSINYISSPGQVSSPSEDYRSGSVSALRPVRRPSNTSGGTNASMTRKERNKANLLKAVSSPRPQV